RWIMREVSWEEDSALGSSTEGSSGSVADLMTGGPYPCISPPEVPPFSVVNEMLSHPGGGGMNGGRRWEPFTISSSDYSELAGDLVSDHGFVSTPVPRWVVTRNDWHIWIMEQRRGVPSDPHRTIQQQADDAVAAYELARRDPTTPPVVLASRFLEAQRKKDDALHFVDPWITAAGFTKYRRLMRWLFDGQNRVKAAEMARDPDLAAQIRVELEGARSRCRPTRSDEAWPPEWNDWPDYPPEEPGRP
ncbi:MAG: hypothetical protein ACLP7F_19825, partial [Acidimicrobiales bacterium]